jgi:hypothetical protein
LYSGYSPLLVMIAEDVLCCVCLQLFFVAELVDRMEGNIQGNISSALTFSFSGCFSL